MTLSSHILQNFSSPLPFPLSISEHELPKERSRAQTGYPKSLFRNQLLSAFLSEFSQFVVEEERVRGGRESRCVKEKGYLGRRCSCREKRENILKGAGEN